MQKNFERQVYNLILPLGHIIVHSHAANLQYLRRSTEVFDVLIILKDYLQLHKNRSYSLTHSLRFWSPGISVVAILTLDSCEARLKVPSVHSLMLPFL